jgi:hypothetical protein
MTRVRDEVLCRYVELAARAPRRAFQPAIVMMRQDLDAAANALAEGDVIAMLRILAVLKAWQL